MAAQKTKEKGKRSHRVGLDLEDDLYERLIRACDFQKHRQGQLAWILIEWALPHYERARSVEGLHAFEPIVASGRISRETQEMLFTALRTILDDAPSATVEEIAALLTDRAGKYGSVEGPPRKAKRA